MKISLIIPTYNERENLETLVPMLHDCLSSYAYELIIVDDDSPDRTSELARELSATYPMMVIQRKGKRGLASAIVDGFKEANGTILGVIDADLQHPPEVVKELAKQMPKYDVIIASRYVKSGKVEGWNLLRRLVSKGATLLARPLTQVKDPMSGCFLAKAAVIKGINFEPLGYKILLEVLVKGNYEKVKEIPYAFRVRRHGQSKLDSGEYFNYLKLLFRLYKYKFISAKVGKR